MIATNLGLAVTAALGVALMAGLFFIFSNTIMRALATLPSVNAVAAMQAINKQILNPIFLFVFFLTPFLCLVLLILEIFSASTNLILVAATACHLGGAFLVTLSKNVPMNNQLASLNPTDSQTADYWQTYRRRWTFWNHIRTLSCLLSLLGFLLALLLNHW